MLQVRMSQVTLLPILCNTTEPCENYYKKLPPLLSNLLDTKRPLVAERQLLAANIPSAEKGLIRKIKICNQSTPLF